MKILLSLCLICALLIGARISAQTAIPNNGFENWSSTEKPANWSPSNIHTTYSGFPVNIITITKDSSNQHSGNFCAKLQSKMVMSGFPVNPGFITLGTFWFTISPQAGGAKGGIPFSGKPDTLKGFYKSTLVGADQSTVFYETWQGAHAVNLAQDTMKLPAAANWSTFALPIHYDNSGSPDSMNIVISCSDYYNQPNIAANSLMYIDDISLVYGSTNIVDVIFSPYFSVYADKLSNTLIIGLSFNKSEMTTIGLYTISGQQIKYFSKNILSSKEEIDLNGFSKGNYIISVERADGQHFTQKISIN